MSPRFVLSLLVVFLVLKLAPSKAAQTASVASWNISSSTRRDDRAIRISRAIRILNPDLIVLTGIESDSMANEINNRLPKYSLTILDENSDRIIALLYTSRVSVTRPRLIYGLSERNRRKPIALSADVMIGELRFVVIAASLELSPSLYLDQMGALMSSVTQDRSLNREVLLIGNISAIPELFTFLRNESSPQANTYIHSCFGDRPQRLLYDRFAASPGLIRNYVTDSVRTVEFTDPHVFELDIGRKFDCARFKTFVSDHLPLVAEFTTATLRTERTDDFVPANQEFWPMSNNELARADKGIFAQPIRISTASANFLSRRSADLNRHQRQLEANLTNLERNGTHARRKNALLSAIAEARLELESTRTDFVSGRFGHRSVDISHLRKAIQVTLEEFEQQYERVSKEIRSMEASEYEGIRDRVLRLLAFNAFAYQIMANERSLTFNLVVKSTPKQGSSISFKRKGDSDYTPNGSGTDTTIENLVFAEWYVRVEQDGFVPQQKVHDAWREKNHVLVFELVPNTSTTSTSWRERPRWRRRHTLSGINATSR